jgi:hypothetical protein
VCSLLPIPRCLTRASPHAGDELTTARLGGGRGGTSTSVYVHDGGGGKGREKNWMDDGSKTRRVRPPHGWMLCGHRLNRTVGVENSIRDSTDGSALNRLRSSEYFLFQGI